MKQSNKSDNMEIKKTKQIPKQELNRCMRTESQKCKIS